MLLRRQHPKIVFQSMIEPSQLPLISIIVPCFNEERTIGLLLDAIVKQSLPKQHIEVIIADGQSTDRTREVIQAFQALNPTLGIHIVENPRRIIPLALNIAIQNSQGEIIIRLDAHCIPYPDYLERCVKALQNGQGDNVGGVWEIRAFENQGKPASAIARSIAAAAAHPLGVGDALYRYANKPQSVDTVPFGAFQRSLVDRVGGFDESLLANEDYEFNARILRSGGVVWLDPAIRSVYFARSDIKALAKQYWRYGFWKARMLRRYANTLRWRQALPPIFVGSLIILSLLSLWSPGARWLLGLQLGGYLLILILAAIPRAYKKKDFFLIFGLPISITTMHLSWGAGLIAGLFAPVRNQ